VVGKKFHQGREGKEMDGPSSLKREAHSSRNSRGYSPPDKGNGRAGPKKKNHKKKKDSVREKEKKFNEKGSNICKPPM